MVIGPETICLPFHESIAGACHCQRYADLGGSVWQYGRITWARTAAQWHSDSLSLSPGTVLLHSASSQPRHYRFSSQCLLYVRYSLKTQCSPSHHFFPSFSHYFSHFSFPETYDPNKFFFLQQFLLLFVLHISRLGTPLRMGPYLVKRGRRPSMTLWYSVPNIQVAIEILIFDMSDPRVVSPRACRRPNLFVPRR